MRGLLMTFGVVVGIVGGAFPRDRELIAGIPGGWPLVAAGIALLAVALFLRLRGQSVSEAAKGSAAAAETAVHRVAGEVRRLLDPAMTAPIHEIATRIDALIRSEIEPVYAAQEALIATQGFARYAAHTGPWAAGERMVYRAWSAATDGHRPEAVASLREAIPHFEEAARAFA